jgi:hypothetical protein
MTEKSDREELNRRMERARRSNMLLVPLRVAWS